MQLHPKKKVLGIVFCCKQRRNRATTALKDLGFVFGENAIAEEDFCPAGSLGQIHQVTKLTLTFSENVVRVQETEYTPRTVPAQLLISEEAFLSVLKRNQGPRFHRQERMCWRSSDPRKSGPDQQHFPK